MKALLNWRYCIIATLFTVGTLSTLAAFGEDDMALLSSIAVHTLLFGVGIGSFYTLGKCLRRWEANGETTETNDGLTEI